VRRETIFDTLKVSLSMVINMIRLLVSWLACSHLLLVGNLYSQDFASFLDVAAANGECLQNYDVSYRISTLADFPKDIKKRDAIISNYKSLEGAACEEEVEELGRLVVDKESGSNPKRILFVRKKRIVKERDGKEYFEFIVWDSGKAAYGTTRDSRNEIKRASVSIARCYDNFFIPSFETYIGRLAPPHVEGYWEDHSVLWEWFKSQTSDLPVVRLPNGRLRFERTFEMMRLATEFDPVTSMLVLSTSIPFEKETGNEILHLATPVRVTWENHKSVYRLKAVVAREAKSGLMYDAVSTFHWHQCNEVDFVFPSQFFEEISLGKCTQFLFDGQSELSEGR
jgi:hypothetical protein